MKNSVSLSKHSLTMREFWKYEHVTVGEIEGEIAALDREVAYFSATEKFLKAGDAQKEIDFLREVAKRKALEGFQRAHKAARRRLDRAFRQNRVEVSRAWRGKIDALRAELTGGIATIDSAYRKKQRQLLTASAHNESHRPTKASPLLSDIEYLLPRLVQKRCFADADVLRKRRALEAKRLSLEAAHEERRRVSQRVKELDQRRRLAKLKLESRLQVRIAELEEGRMREVAQFGRFCLAQRLKVSRTQIRDFTRFEKAASRHTSAVAQQIQRYGKAIRMGAAALLPVARQTVIC